MHSTIIIFACFIYFKSLSVLSLRLFRTFLQSLLNLPAAEKDLFLPWWLQYLPAETCRSGQFSFIILCWGNFSKIPFIWKCHCVFLNLIYFFQPLPLRGPWYMQFVLTRNHFCNWCWSSNYWDLFNRQKWSCLNRSYWNSFSSFIS